MSERREYIVVLYEPGSFNGYRKGARNSRVIPMYPFETMKAAEEYVEWYRGPHMDDVHEKAATEQVRADERGDMGDTNEFRVMELVMSQTKIEIHSRSVSPWRLERTGITMPQKPIQFADEVTSDD